jgi:hypothetical protein
LTWAVVIETVRYRRGAQWRPGTWSASAALAHSPGHADKLRAAGAHDRRQRDEVAAIVRGRSR